MNKTIAAINRQLESATIQQQREFLYYLMGWLETAEGENKIHPNTVLGVEYAARTSLNRNHERQEKAA